MTPHATVARFVEHGPIAVTMCLALDAQSIDALIEFHSEWQCALEMLFSTTVKLMAMVLEGLRSSTRAVATGVADPLVSIGATYG